MKQGLKKIIPLVLQTSAWYPTRFFFNYFLHFKVTGLENLKGIKGPVIFASNHVSELDPILVTASLDPKTHFIPLFYTSVKSYSHTSSIKGFRRFMYGGIFFKAWGAYPIYSGKKDYAYALQEHVKLLSEGNSVLIFPEGRISKTGDLGEIHGGVAYLGETTKLPLILVSISGAHKITLRDFFKRKRTVSITFFPKEAMIITESNSAEFRKAANTLMRKTK